MAELDARCVRIRADRMITHITDYCPQSAIDLIDFKLIQRKSMALRDSGWRSAANQRNSLTGSKTVSHTDTKQLLPVFGQSQISSKSAR